MKIKAFDIDGHGATIQPCPVRRSWMDSTGNRFAYRCLPMNIANMCGWQLNCPCGFTAIWNGGRTDKADLKIAMDEPGMNFAQSHFTNGLLTLHTGFIFRTPSRVNMWVRGPMNSPKPRIQALEGIVETDWANSTFTMNWIFTEPGTVRFEKGEPFCVIVPYPRNYIEQFEGEIVPLSQEPEMRDAFKAWSASRADFLQHLGDPSHAAGRDGWQKDYMLGRDVGEPTVDDHQTHLELRPFLKNGKAR